MKRLAVLIVFATPFYRLRENLRLRLKRMHKITFQCLVLFNISSLIGVSGNIRIASSIKLLVGFNKPNP